MDMNEKLKMVQQKLSDLSAEEGLLLLAREPGQGIVFSTSFGIEDQVITHLIASRQLPFEIFTLDTGRLFAETYSTWSRTLEQYNINITAFYPAAEAVERFVTEKGPNSFYESFENRKQCCHIRKVEPLQRALKGKSVWITGIRAEQSPGRHYESKVEWDDVNCIIKYHPLLNWTFKEVKNFVNKNNIPFNPLHDKGFVSIGCAPCTRAIKSGEDFRAGRWWWEDNSKKECGLHIHATEETKK
jgi:phosphoadenosine phosphosulfate reductase